MKIQRHITIDAPPEKVWKVLGQDFDQVDQWASSVTHSVSRTGGQKLASAPMAGRTCETEIGPVKEAILEFDEDQRIVAYSAQAQDFPFFVKDMQNRWALTEAPGRRTEVDMLMSARLLFPFNLVMTLPMKMQIGKLLTFAVEELKHYVETGKPHPRKVQASVDTLKATA